MSAGICTSTPYAYDLLATNERIIAASCDAAIGRAPGTARLRKVTTILLVVFESADEWPSYEWTAVGGFRRRL